MNALFRDKLGALLAAAILVCSGALEAQTPPPLPAPQGVSPAKTPPLPVVKSPVEMFRNLLAKSPAEREQTLANRPEAIRKRILEKIAEYEAMKPDERELRLRSTQLHWYVLQFMRTPISERSAQLAEVPQVDRDMIARHLQVWDQLSANEQQQILKYEQTMENLAGQRLEGVAASNAIIAAVSAPARGDALTNLENFLKLPAEQREQMFTSFQRFFQLSDDDKQKAMGGLSAPQRERLSAALKMMKGLRPDDRAEYLKGLRKCLSMSDAERNAFMKNAENWQKLTPAERAAWRTLINGLSPVPPLPSGFVYPPRPPLPAFPLQVSLPVRTNADQ